MQYVAAILYGWASATLIAIGSGFANGSLNHTSAIASLLGGASVALIAILCGRRRGTPERRPRGWEWFPVVLFALFALRAFLWLIFRDGNELLVLSPNNLGDMSLHLTFINYLANGAPFWPDSPIFASGKLTYSIGTDLFNSLLVLAGVDIVRGLIWVGLIGAALTGYALWRWGGAFALLGFLCGGGLLGLAAFTVTSNEPFFQDYAGVLMFDWAWKSLPLALLVTQRGFLFALPAGLLLLSSWRSRFLGSGSQERLPFLGELLLYAAMPIFHLHTFIALSFVLASWFLCRAPARAQILRLVGVAFIPATLLVYLTVGMFKSNAEPTWGDMGQFENPPQRPGTQILGWQPGWMVNEPLERLDPWTTLVAETPALQPLEGHGRFLFFWIGNFGVLPFFAAAAACTLVRRLSQRSLCNHWVLLALFLVITPLLGRWESYQTRSLSGWLLGTHEASLASNILLGIVAALCAALAIYGHYRRRFHPVVRWLFTGFGTIFLLDAALATAHLYAPGIPLLRANALPLLAATAAFLALLLLIAPRWKPELLPAALVFPGLYLFFLCCNVKFAPAPWDNTKLMIWAYLLVLPPLWELIIARWSWWIRGAALILLFFSGFIGLIGGLNSQYQGYPIARLSELDSLREATKHIPITETFAADPIYDHPLLLNGRKLVLGYPAHLWSHGILFQQQERQLDRLMQGASDWRMQAARLNVRYLFRGFREAEKWPQAPAGWRDGAQRIYSSEWGDLFDLETPPIPVTP